MRKGAGEVSVLAGCVEHGIALTWISTLLCEWCFTDTKILQCWGLSESLGCTMCERPASLENILSSCQTRSSGSGMTRCWLIGWCKQGTNGHLLDFLFVLLLVWVPGRHQKADQIPRGNFQPDWTKGTLQVILIGPTLFWKERMKLRKY